MKKLSIILAALVLVLLCGCAADPAPAQDLDEAEQTAAEPVRVATFTADILSAGGDMLMVSPESGSFADASATSVTVQLAEGLVPTGADGWPIAISELSPELCVDITYLGDPTPGDPAEVIAVAIRVVPDEDVPPVQPDPTPVQPDEPQPEEPVYEPFTTIELPIQDAVPAKIPYDGLTLYGFQAVRTEIVSRGEADLDGCGTPEEVQILRIWDQYDQQSFILRVQKDDEIFDTGMVEQSSYPPSFNAHVWLADLDADGYPEIYFCGDMASDDYVLNVWSFKSGAPELIPIDGEQYLEAEILDISDGSLQLESTQDVLGSYQAVRAYVLCDGELCPLGDAWQIVPANTSYSRLSVVMELPVTLDDGTQTTFPQGTVLQVTGTDGKSFVDVVTEDGTAGRVYIEKPEGDWQWYIAGEPELNYFELVPYAG